MCIAVLVAAAAVFTMRTRQRYQNSELLRATVFLLSQILQEVAAGVYVIENAPLAILITANEARDSIITMLLQYIKLQSRTSGFSFNESALIQSKICPSAG